MCLPCGETAPAQPRNSKIQEPKSTAVIDPLWRGGKRRSSMDILASIFAYLVGVTGIVGGLVVSFVIVFSPPAPQPAAPGPAMAMMVKPSPVRTAAIAASHPAVRIKQSANHLASAVSKSESKSEGKSEAKSIASSEAVLPPSIAIDARQKPLMSQAAMRRLAERERARHLASRERLSFEARFLHYDD